MSSAMVWDPLESVYVHIPQPRHMVQRALKHAIASALLLICTANTFSDRSRNSAFGKCTPSPALGRLAFEHTYGCACARRVGRCVYASVSLKQEKIQKRDAKKNANKQGHFLHYQLEILPFQPLLASEFDFWMDQYTGSKWERCHLNLEEWRPLAVASDRTAPLDEPLDGGRTLFCDVTRCDVPREKITPEYGRTHLRTHQQMVMAPPQCKDALFPSGKERLHS